MPVNNASRRSKFFFLDGFAALPLLLVLLHPRYSTLIILCVVITVILIFEKKGVPLPMLLRRIRVLAIGNRRYIRSPWRKR
jgi:cell division protein FtsW (lipid II flippase)